MKSLESFKTFYEEQLVHELEPIESLRKVYVKKTLINIVILIVVVFAAIALFSLFISIGIVLIVAIGVLIWSIPTLITRKTKLKRGILIEFKINVIQKMIQFIDENLQYDHHKCITHSAFAQSKIYTNIGERYTGDDWVGGRVGQTDVEFSEIHVEDVHRNKDGDDVYSTIFKGIFFIADFHKDFKGKTFVLNDTAEKLFGRIGTVFQKMNSDRPQLIKLEDVVFEKQFVVYGSDQIEARYIITPVMMERMITLSKLFKGVQFSFVNSKVFITIPQKRDMFEPNYFKPLTDFKYLKDYYVLLFHCISLVETLELNNRIWSKE